MPPSETKAAVVLRLSLNGERIRFWCMHASARFPQDDQLGDMWSTRGLLAPVLTIELVRRRQGERPPTPGEIRLMESYITDRASVEVIRRRGGRAYYSLSVDDAVMVEPPSPVAASWLDPRIFIPSITSEALRARS